MSYYSNFRNEVINTAMSLYNLIPEEIRDIIKEGMVVASDFNNVVKIIQLYNKFKERFLIKKIDLFLKSTDNLSIEEINELVKKCQISKEKFMEQLIITIDKLESEEKIDYFSRLFILFVKTDMDKRLYFRCCKILENYSYYDINSFSRKSNYSISDEEDILAFSMGLLQNKPQGGIQSDNKHGILRQPVSMLGMTELVLSKAGEVFLELNNI